MRRTRRLATLVVGLMMIGGPAYAQDGSAAALESLQLGALVLYLMVATVLVFIMHAGFALLEAGMTRTKNAANIIGKNLMTLTVGLLTYYAIGWGLMYGTNVAGLFGSDMFFLLGGDYAPDSTLSMDFAFQAMFAATAATIVSGAVAERIKFGGYLIVAVAMTAIIYPIVGAWTWGGGWLDALGFYDFAGSTIVHLTGGAAAFVGAAILGARIGKYDRKTGKPRAIPGHSMPLAALGTLLLFFGWFGFNGGSVLALDGEAIANVIVTTALAGSAGGFAAGAYTRIKNGKWDVAMMANGILAGLVGITAGADAVANWAAVTVGLLAGVLVAVAVHAIDLIKVDDPVGASSVHGVCGVLGTLWVGIAATEGGLLYGGGVGLLVAQVVGVVGVIAWVGGATAVLFLALKVAGLLRVSEQEEVEGLDVWEHGVAGYPELVFAPGDGLGGDYSYQPGGAPVARAVPVEE